MTSPAKEPRAPLVHIGYHKTATTWLQRRVFDDPRCGFRRYPSPLIARRLIEPHPFAFDPEACRAELRPWIETAQRADLVPVLSHERLSGYPHSGGFDSLEVLDRLANVVPAARILITIREQRAIIASNYHQYIVDGGASPLERYLDPPQAGPRRVPGFALEFFQFDRLIEAYRSRFGADKVLVLLYEEFRAQPAEYLRRLGSFAGVNADLGHLNATTAQVVNPAPSPSVLGLLRWANLLFSANPLNPSPIMPSRVASVFGTVIVRGLDRLPIRTDSSRLVRRENAVVAHRIEGAFEESNARLSKSLAVDLESYGYAVRRADGDESHG